MPASDKAHDIALEDAIQKLAGHPQATETGHEPLMYKLCLPVEKAPLLMLLLGQEGISAASIFPGYAGVVEAKRERHAEATVTIRLRVFDRYEGVEVLVDRATSPFR